MLVHAGLTQTVFDTPLPPGSPWWAVVLILIVSVITFVIRQSMTNRTASLETNLRLALQKQ